MLRSKKLPLTCLITIIAFIGISWQMFDETRKFFSYPIFSRIWIEPEVTRLPVITFCISEWYSGVRSKINKLPIGKVSQFIPKLNETLIECHLTLPNGTVVKCLSISKIHRYMNYQLYCYSMFEKDYSLLPDEELIYEKSSRMENNQMTPLIKLILKSPFKTANHWAMNIEDIRQPFTLLRGTESKVWFEPELNEHVKVSYDVVQRYELPAPYPGDCIDYGEGYNSMYLVTQCWLQNHYVTPNKTHVWPAWTLYDINGNYSIDKNNYSYVRSESSRKYFYQVNKKCLKKFPKIECNRKYYISNTISSRRTVNFSQHSHFTAEIPWIPPSKLIIESIPKLDLISFISELGGIFSMWIGFSLFGSLNNITFMKHSKPKRGKIVDYFLHKTLMKRPRKKENKKKIVKLISQFINIICFAVTIYLVISIILIYFERPFQVILYSYVPESISMSRLTMCFDLIIDPLKMKQFYPLIHQNVQPHNWRYHLTVGQLYNVTFDWYDVYVNKSYFLSPDTSKQELIVNYFNFTRSFDGNQMCYSTFGLDEYKKPGKIMPHSRAQIIYAQLFHLHLNASQLIKRNLNNFALYIHRNYHIDNDLTASNRISINVDEKEERRIALYLIRLSTYTNSLYSSHFKSTCWDYKEKFGIESRKMAIDLCVEENFREKYRLCPTGYRVSKPVKLKFSSELYSKKLKTIEESCRRKYFRKDCKSLYQTVETVSKSRAGHHGKDREPSDLHIALYPPSNHFYEYVQQLIFSVVDILGYTGGTINTWIGISFLDIEFVALIIYKGVRRFYSFFHFER